MTEEYGGYLPFEFKNGNEYYQGKEVVALNCARNAIVYAVRDAQYDRIWIPFYMCESVRQTLERYGIRYAVYHMNEKLEPIDVCMDLSDCILYPHFFGIFTQEKIDAVIERYQQVILDNTQAFFAKPDDRVYNVYSCRKFFGVSDGAYVVKKGIKHIAYPKDYSGDRMIHLFKSIEKGTNAAYKDSLRAEEMLSEAPVMEMSVLTHKILQSTDYEGAVKRRRENFLTVNEKMKEWGIMDIQLPEENVPMVYPFFCRHKDARRILIDNKIYIPQWWKYLLDYPEINEVERELSDYLLPLPIDQRYDREDILRMLSIIRQEFKKQGIWE